MGREYAVRRQVAKAVRALGPEDRKKAGGVFSPSSARVRLVQGLVMRRAGCWAAWPQGRCCLPRPFKMGSAQTEGLSVLRLPIASPDEGKSSYEPNKKSRYDEESRKAHERSIEIPTPHAAA